MGADYIGNVVTVVEKNHEACSKEKLEKFLQPQETVKRLLDASRDLKEEAGAAADTWALGDVDWSQVEDEEAIIEAAVVMAARELLIEGWETLMHPRYHNYWPLGRGLALIVSGGMSWGDAPYDGFNAEAALLAASMSDSELGALTGIVGGVPEVDFIESWLQSGEAGA